MGIAEDDLHCYMFHQGFQLSYMYYHFQEQKLKDSVLELVFFEDNIDLFLDELSSKSVLAVLCSLGNISRLQKSDYTSV